MQVRGTFVIIAFSLLFRFIGLNAQTWGDYTLYSVQNTTTAQLIDMNNKVYHSWTFNSNARTGYSSYLLPGGTIIRSVIQLGTPFKSGGVTGRVQKVDWNGNVLWDFVYSSATYCLHHDICPMPNGNVLMISYEIKTASEAAQAGCSKNISIWSDKIIEVKPTGLNTGEIVWEWHAWDHLCQSYNASKNNYVSSVSEHPELLNINYNTTQDWLHMNGLDYNEDLDQIVISSHFLNEFYVIDHSTTSTEAAGHAGGNSGKGGDFLYRWGNPAAYGVSGTKIFNVVHDAHWIPEGCPKANSFAAYNNKGGAGNKTCVDIIPPPYDGYNYTRNSGTAFEPSTYSWRHVFSGSPTQDLGNSQMLPNGNILICISQSGYLYEIDSNQVLKWSTNVQGMISQAFRYSYCYVNGTLAETPTISSAGNALQSSIGSSYQWYFNGEPIPNATNQSIIPSKPGKYRVSITNSTGCESRLSVPYFYNGSASIDDQNRELLQIYPNPTNGILNISPPREDESDFEISIFDMIGIMVLKTVNLDTIDIYEFDNGLYYLAYKSDKLHTVKKILLVK